MVADQRIGGNINGKYFCELKYLLLHQTITMVIVFTCVLVISAKKSAANYTATAMIIWGIFQTDLSTARAGHNNLLVKCFMKA